MSDGNDKVNDKVNENGTDNGTGDVDEFVNAAVLALDAVNSPHNNSVPFVYQPNAEYIQPDTGYDFRCMRCGHQWRSKHPVRSVHDTPVQCSKCHSGYWRKPKVKGQAEGNVNSPGKRKRRKVAQARVKKAKATVESNVKYCIDNGVPVAGVVNRMPTPPPSKFVKLRGE